MKLIQTKERNTREMKKLHDHINKTMSSLRKSYQFKQIMYDIPTESNRSIDLYLIDFVEWSKTTQKEITLLSISILADRVSGQPTIETYFNSDVSYDSKDVTMINSIISYIPKIIK